MTTRRNNAEGTLYQLPDGRWRATTPRRAGAPVRTKTLQSKKDVAAWLKETLANDLFNELHPELAPAPAPAPAPTSAAQTVGALLDEYMRRHVAGSDDAETTKEGKRYSLARAKRYLGDIAVADLDAETYEALEDRMVADGLSWSSIKQVRSLVSLAWRKRRVRLQNPTLGLDRPPDVVVKTHDKIALSADERDRLVAGFAEHRMRAGVILQAYLGLRPGEMLGLCWDCVDLDATPQTITIRRQVSTLKNRPTVVPRVKTPSSKRTLMLSPGMAEAMRIHRLLREDDESPLVFPTRDGLPTGQRNWADQLERVVTTVGLPRITPHELRHTAATLMMASGMSPLAVADVLGHGDEGELAVGVYRHRGEMVVASSQVPDLGGAPRSDNL